MESFKIELLTMDQTLMEINCGNKHQKPHKKIENFCSLIAVIFAIN
jgi:hypothetical protein